MMNDRRDPDDLMTLAEISRLVNLLPRRTGELMHRDEVPVAGRRNHGALLYRRADAEAWADRLNAAHEQRRKYRDSIDTEWQVVRELARGRDTLSTRELTAVTGLSSRVIRSELARVGIESPAAAKPEGPGTPPLLWPAQRILEWLDSPLIKFGKKSPGSGRVTGSLNARWHRLLDAIRVPGEFWPDGDRRLTLKVMAEITGIGVEATRTALQVNGVRPAGEEPSGSRSPLARGRLYWGADDIRVWLETPRKWIFPPNSPSKSTAGGVFFTENPGGAGGGAPDPVQVAMTELAELVAPRVTGRSVARQWKA